jgi:hypothetical protein
LGAPNTPLVPFIGRRCYQRCDHGRREVAERLFAWPTYLWIAAARLVVAFVMAWHEKQRELRSLKSDLHNTQELLRKDRPDFVVEIRIVGFAENHSPGVADVVARVRITNQGVAGSVTSCWMWRDDPDGRVPGLDRVEMSTALRLIGSSYVEDVDVIEECFSLRGKELLGKRIEKWDHLDGALQGYFRRPVQLDPLSVRVSCAGPLGEVFTSGPPKRAVMDESPSFMVSEINAGIDSL